MNENLPDLQDSIHFSLPCLDAGKKANHQQKNEALSHSIFAVVHTLKSPFD
jgi:hypothetical protein